MISFYIWTCLSECVGYNWWRDSTGTLCLLIDIVICLYVHLAIFCSTLLVEKFHFCFDLEFVRRLKFWALFNKTPGFRGITHNLSLLPVDCSPREKQDCCYKLWMQCRENAKCGQMWNVSSLLWKKVFAQDFKLILGFENLNNHVFSVVFLARVVDIGLQKLYHATNSLNNNGIKVKGIFSDSKRIIFLASFVQMKAAQIFGHLFLDGWWLIYGLAFFVRFNCFYRAEPQVSFGYLQRTISLEETLCSFSQNNYSHRELSGLSWTFSW